MTIGQSGHSLIKGLTASSFALRSSRPSLRNFGSDTAKPDIHIERLARRENTTTHKLCRRLANQTGYRIATIDSVLWRACELKILESDVYEQHGWRAAFTRKARRQATPQPQADAPFTKQQGAEDPETGSNSRTS